MKILDDLLSILDYEAQVRDIRQGVFQTAVFTRNCGLASSPHETGVHHGERVVKEAGLLLKKDVRELAGMAKSASLYEASIGMAAINSLLIVDEKRCEEINASVLLERKGEGKNIAIVGHFPFIPQLGKSAKELWVIEKNPIEGDYTEDKAEKLLPEADVAGITGTALTNHTLEHLLGLCRPGTFVMILGGTAPLSPVLFDYGINAISGTVVTEPETVLKHVSQGATFRQLKGVKLLTMEK